jgi:anti-sigma regulatory factor (Ser/Thr protein kinase)
MPPWRRWPELADTPERRRLDVAASATGAREAAEWLARECDKLRVPPDQVYRVDTCMSEALANVIAHGGEKGLAAPVGLVLSVGFENGQAEAVLSISDHGVAFDSVAAVSKPRPVSLDDAVPGGLGLTMIREFSDTQHYAYGDAQNHLTLSFRWTTS